MKKMIVLGVCFILFLNKITAQNSRNVNGTVTDEKGMPLTGVTVSAQTAAKKTVASVVTDATGNFTIKIEDKVVNLFFSFVGMEEQSVSVKGTSTVSVKLKASNSTLSDVVVVAFGVTSSKRSAAFSTGSVNAEQITRAGNDNIASSLSGKIAGADFVGTGSGAMGGNRINIRGINSLDVNSRPLIIVNGIPIFDNDDSYAGRGAGAGQKGSGINDINPDDIESLTVLKGANAAALYGSQAINGAIIIQTKTGKKGKGIGVDFNSAYTYNQNAYLPKFQEEYGAGASADNFEQYVYKVAGFDSLPFYQPKGNQSINFGPKFSNQPVMWWDGQVRPWQGQPNNYKDLFTDGASINNTIAMSGANDKGSFRLSATNYKYTGFLPNMKETRNSVLFNGSQKLSDFITVDFYANYIENFRQNPPERIDRANFSILNTDITSVIKDNAVSAAGYYLSDSAFKYLNGTNLSSNIITPLIWDQVMNLYQDQRNTFLGTATVTVKLPEHLSLRLRVGTNRLWDQLEQKRPFTAYAAPTNLTTTQGYYGKSTANNYKNHADLLLTYNNQVSKNFSLNAFAGYSMDDEYDETNSLGAPNGLLYNNFYSAANFKPKLYTAANSTALPSALGASAGQSGERLNAVFASAMVGYKNWLYVTATDRNDWSSYLPAATNHYNYPSVGAGFIFSDVFKMPAYVSYGKLRVSYGVTGVPGARYFANANYSQGSTYNGAILSSFNNTVPQSNLVAEKNTSFEMGLEGGLFQNRLRLDFSFYTNNSNNMINAVTIAASTGASTLNVNAGSLQNKGFEWQLTGDIIKTKNVLWQMSINGTTISRKVLSLPVGLTKRTLGTTFSTNMFAVPGGVPYDIYMNPIATNADGAIQVSAAGQPVFSTTQVDVGSSLPKVYGGYSNSVSYKRFTLTALLQYRYGGKIVSYDNVFWTATGLSKESLAGRDASHGGLAYYVQGGVNVALGTGTAPAGTTVYHDGILINGEYANGTANTSIVKASTYYQNRYYNFGTTDAVYDNNYIKLGEVTLSYSLPQSVIKKMKVQGLSVSLIARNVAFLYKTVPNESPDATLGTDNVNSGILYSAYPLSRNLGAALKVSF